MRQMETPMRKRFYKASHKAFYVHHNGKPVKLGKTEPEAMAAWAALQSVEQPQAPTEKPQVISRTLGAVIDEWLSYTSSGTSRQRPTRATSDTLRPGKSFTAKPRPLTSGRSTFAS